MRSVIISGTAADEGGRVEKPARALVLPCTELIDLPLFRLAPPRRFGIREGVMGFIANTSEADECWGGKDELKPVRDDTEDRSDLLFDPVLGFLFGGFSCHLHGNQQ